MKKNIIRQTVQWCVCFLIGFLIINIFCFPYHRTVGWINIPNGATDSVWQPYSYMVHASEGYSISKTDKNGYLNPDKELADNYVLMMGSSHTQAIEVKPDKKYSAIVNDYLSDDDKLHTYNIGISGCFLPSQIKHFKAALQAFPNSSAVTIEILGTDYSIEQLEDALEQSAYDEQDSVLRFNEYSGMSKAKLYVKNSLPMLSKIKKNIETIKKAKAGESTYEVDKAEYKKVINEALSKMRSEYSGPMVFVYHPGVAINADGTISLQYSETWDEFKEACVKNNIDVIDSGENFLKYYDENCKVPYGFLNTSLANGHLNETGHAILAQEIIDWLEEENK